MSRALSQTVYREESRERCESVRSWAGGTIVPYRHTYMQEDENNSSYLTSC